MNDGYDDDDDEGKGEREEKEKQRNTNAPTTLWKLLVVANVETLACGVGVMI